MLSGNDPCRSSPSGFVYNIFIPVRQIWQADRAKNYATEYNFLYLTKANRHCQSAVFFLYHKTGIKHG
jgi:hypothetical protein